MLSPGEDHNHIGLHIHRHICLKAATRKVIMIGITLHIQMHSHPGNIGPIDPRLDDKHLKTGVSRTESPTNPDHSTNKLLPTQTTVPTNSYQPRPQYQPQHMGWKCEYCGGHRYYVRDHCPASGQKCYQCGKIGHFKYGRWSNSRKEFAPVRRSQGIVDGHKGKRPQSNFQSNKVPINKGHIPSLLDLDLSFVPKQHTMKHSAKRSLFVWFDALCPINNQLNRDGSSWVEPVLS